MSFQELPPRSAPLARRLSAAMARAGYTQIALAHELGTDRSLVSKWMRGVVKSVRKPEHRENLARLLSTSIEYWIELSPAERPEDELRTELQSLKERVDRLESRD